MRTEHNAPVDYFACFADKPSSSAPLSNGLSNGSNGSSNGLSNGLPDKSSNGSSDGWSKEAPDDEQELHLNPLIGSNILISYGQAITCLHCGRVTKKSFSQGYCYPCFKKLPQCDLCIMSPDRCHYDQGTCRDPAWGESFCMQEHIVYLANSSGLKVGITRPSQIPTRWIDQGAMQAMPIMRVATRQQSGLVEAAFKKHVSDKTHWQKMLKADSSPQDLNAVRDELFSLVKDDIAALQNKFGLQALQILENPKEYEIQFPVTQYPTKVKSINLEKTPEVTGKLIGIKGQYLILDIGVINLRKYTSYEVEITESA